MMKNLFLIVNIYYTLKEKTEGPFSIATHTIVCVNSRKAHSENIALNAKNMHYVNKRP